MQASYSEQKQRTTDPQSLSEIRQTYSTSPLLYFAQSEYDGIYAIDLQNRTGTTLWQKEPQRYTTQGESQPYDDSLDALLGPNCTDLNPDDVIRSMKLDAVEKALQKEPLYRVFYNRYLSSGFQAYRKATFRLLPGSIRFAVLTIQDLTDAFQAEEARRKDLAAALEETRKHLDANNVFLSLLSRDIRTPLHSILGFTQIANAELSDISAVEGYLHKISMSGIYMAETIDDIRDLIMILWNPISLNNSPFSLSEFFSHTRVMLHQKAEEKQLSLDTRSGSFSSDTVYADQAVLGKIIAKLARNITSYTLRGGSIHASALEKEHRNGILLLEITVNSRGIDYDPKRLHILDLSMREIQEEMRVSLSNIELDLVILKAYVSAMGGTITSSATEGLGTKIVLELPLNTEPKPGQPVKLVRENIPAATSPDGIRRFKGKTLLLADDDDANREVERKLLEQAGFIVLTVRNGKEALEMLNGNSRHICAVLMDVRMPVMDGLEAVREIRSMADESIRRIPVIALTASTEPEDVRASLAAGMNEHLNKPLDQEALARVLSQYIR